MRKHAGDVILSPIRAGDRVCVSTVPSFFGVVGKVDPLGDGFVYEVIPCDAAGKPKSRAQTKRVNETFVRAMAPEELIEELRYALLRGTRFGPHSATERARLEEKISDLQKIIDLSEGPFSKPHGG